MVRDMKLKITYLETGMDEIVDVKAILSTRKKIVLFKENSSFCEDRLQLRRRDKKSFFPWNYS